MNHREKVVKAIQAWEASQTKVANLAASLKVAEQEAEDSRRGLIRTLHAVYGANKSVLYGDRIYTSIETPSDQPNRLEVRKNDLEILSQ